MRNFTDDLADQNKHFKFLVRGVFQHMEPPISATFRENAEGYFHRWLVSERLDMNVDVNDEQTMHQYGIAFSDPLVWKLEIVWQRYGQNVYPTSEAVGEQRTI